MLYVCLEITLSLLRHPRLIVVLPAKEAPSFVVFPKGKNESRVEQNDIQQMTDALLWFSVMA